MRHPKEQKWSWKNLLRCNTLNSYLTIWSRSTTNSTSWMSRELCSYSWPKKLSSTELLTIRSWLKTTWDVPRPQMTASLRNMKSGVRASTPRSESSKALKRWSRRTSWPVKEATHLRKMTKKMTSDDSDDRTIRKVTLVFFNFNDMPLFGHLTKVSV